MGSGAQAVILFIDFYGTNAIGAMCFLKLTNSETNLQFSKRNRSISLFLCANSIISAS